MHNSHYTDALNWLFQQFPSYQEVGSSAYKPTLENTRKICKHFGNPQNDLKFVHVAGSNGKGTVSSILASSLTESNFKVGLFTSPHIVDFRERIRINGTPISESTVVEFVANIKKADFDFSPSFFEITFCLALIEFKRSNTDICIIETGLGGRLDATNIITSLLSVITTISLEHTEILGDTIKQIAREKGGIIKPSIPVIIGNVSKDAFQVLSKIASDHKSTLYQSDLNKELVVDHNFITEYQIENLKLAIASLELLHSIGFKTKNESIEKGLINIYKNTGYFGRFQITERNPNLVFDVSHNEDGIKATLKSINHLNKGKLFVIFGASQDKNLNSIKNLFSEETQLFCTEFDHLRAAKIAKLKFEFSQTNLKSISYYTDPKIALKDAKTLASIDDTILVMGSFFLISKFF